jgi:hypothetical protein
MPREPREAIFVKTVSSHHLGLRLNPHSKKIGLVQTLASSIDLAVM